MTVGVAVCVIDRWALTFISDAEPLTRCVD